MEQEPAITKGDILKKKKKKEEAKTFQILKLASLFKI